MSIWPSECYMCYLYLSLYFQVFMLDQEAGTAQLKARHPLNCEEKRRHVVSVAAVSCSGAASQR